MGPETLGGSRVDGPHSQCLAGPGSRRTPRAGPRFPLRLCPVPAAAASGRGPSVLGGGSPEPQLQLLQRLPPSIWPGLEGAPGSSVGSHSLLWGQMAGLACGGQATQGCDGQQRARPGAIRQLRGSRAR